MSAILWLPSRAATRIRFASVAPRTLPVTLRRAAHVIDWAWSSALSRGPGYEPHPRGRAFSADAIRGYFLDYRAKTNSAATRTPERLTPAGLAQLALGWWERSLDGDALAGPAFEEAARRLLSRAEETDGALKWAYEMCVPKFGLEPPWRSALAQGQAASVFVRMHLSTGDDAWAGSARAAVAPLLELSGELVCSTPEGPILEEAPSIPSSHILNGWISALFGVLDVAIALDDARASHIFATSTEALRRHLGAYDTGWWTRYSLYPHPVEDLAKPIYHRLHADQIDMLHRVTGIQAFQEAAVRWRSYDRALPRMGAIAQKSLFVVVDGRRRRNDQRAQAARRA
jgi:heparosan-N-sulfate-glucuronate 5-epimerase